MADVEALTFENPWIRRARRPGARMRLLCFPHAGAGASAFAEWPALLPHDIELLAVQLPGREGRVGENPVANTGALVRSLGQAIRPYLSLPIAFFGHSGGALLAFEVARALRQRTEVAWLFLSGHAAPHLPPREPLHVLDDARFEQEITELGGFSDAVMADTRFRRLLLRAVRDDFTLWETHAFAPSQPLKTPITAFGGEDDPRATLDGMRAWAEQTTGPFRLRAFAGGHFFVISDREALLKDLTRDLNNVR